MASMPTTRLRDDLADTLNRVAYKGERIVLERRGKRVAVLVPVEDLDLLEALEDRIDVEAAREALKSRARIPWKRLKSELGL